MIAKQYLGELRNQDLYIKALKEEYEVLLTRATKITSVLGDDRVQTSYRGGKENLMAKCTQISVDIDSAISELIDLQSEARLVIYELEDHRYKSILSLRYLSGKRWEEVSEITGYDLRWVHRLHGEALIELEKILATKSHGKPL